MAYEDDVKNFRGNMRQHSGGVQKPKAQKPHQAGMERGGGNHHAGKKGHSIHKAEGGGFHHTLHHEDGTQDEHTHDNYDEAESHGREHMMEGEDDMQIPDEGLPA